MTDIETVLDATRVCVSQLSARERAQMLAAQGRGWVIAEAALGRDADEAAYRRAMARGDSAALARLEAAAETRGDAARRILDGGEG